jgi:hypothetical protein
LGFPNVPSIAEQCGGAHGRALRIGGGRDHVTARTEKGVTLLNKVQEVTMIFWFIKIKSTTVGETGADYLAVHVGGTAITGIIMAALLISALIIQLLTKTYTPGIYWLTIVLVSVVGAQRSLLRSFVAHVRFRPVDRPNPLVGSRPASVVLIKTPEDGDSVGARREGTFATIELREVRGPNPNGV